MGTAPLFGRKQELAVLARHFAATSSGQGGRLILITGGPSVGKTRLAAEIGRLTTEQGGCFLAGRYLRDGATFGPWAELLRPGLTVLPPGNLAEMVRPYERDLSQVLPEIPLWRSQEATPTPGDAVPSVLTPADHRLRLYEGIVGVLHRLARRQPLALLLDDLQWAPGLILLLHVARRLDPMPVLVIGTARDIEFGEQPSHVQGWGEMRRLRWASDLALQPLDAAATGQLVSWHVDAGPAARLQDRMYQSSGGNPSFIEEALRLLGATGVVRRTPAAMTRSRRRATTMCPHRSDGAGIYRLVHCWCTTRVTAQPG